MKKVIDLKPKENHSFDDFINQIKENKKTFIPPKQKMKDSIDNDAKYLMALGGFIENAQRELNKLINQQKTFEAAKLQLEIFDAIGKFQANENIVHDKTLHYEKVFLPMYEEELKESAEKFTEAYEKVCTIYKQELGEGNSSKEKQKIQSFIKKEFDAYHDSNVKENEEFKNYTYKIFKRLINKYEELDSQKAIS